jgi:hypothetical protein
MPKLKKLRLSKDLPGVNLYRKDKFAFVFRNVGLTSHRVKTTPAFAVTRRKAAAFSQAATTARYIYRTLLPFMEPLNSGDCYKRLLARIVQSTNASGTSPAHWNANALTGFQCNLHAFPQPTLHKHCTLHYIKEENTAIAHLPPLFPLTHINAPIGATHFQPALLLAAIYPHTGQKEIQTACPSVFHRLYLPTTKTIDLSLKIDPTRPAILLAAIKISFCLFSDHSFQTFYPKQSTVLDIFAIQIISSHQSPPYASYPPSGTPS